MIPIWNPTVLNCSSIDRVSITTLIKLLYLKMLALLNKGLQLAFFAVLIGFFIMFMKFAVLEQRVKNIEASQTQYLTYDEYLETFKNMWLAETQKG